jgi:hypothetical protein
MKILNDIACTLTWIKNSFNSFQALTEELIFKFNNWNELNSNTLIGIWTKLNQVPVQQIQFKQLDYNSVEKKKKCKLMKNMLCIWCWGSGIKLNTNLKRHFFTWKWAKQN